MKKAIFLVVTALVLVSCKEEVDPIWATQKVNESYAKDFPLNEFHKLGQTGDTIAQRSMVNRYRKQLTKNVIKNYPCIKDNKNIKFVLGSGIAEKVQAGDGKFYDGKFKNELIIILTDPCIKDTLFLACGNGMLEPLKFNSQSSFGTAEKCRFEIKRGEGLAHHLPVLQEWAKVAGSLQIAIRNPKGKVVQEETYINYLGRYQSVLFTGDVIDMCQGKVFNQRGQEVDFKSRLRETKLANKKLLVKKNAKAHKQNKKK
jgi:hypothetical protein